jgi:hypothetical protein
MRDGLGYYYIFAGALLTGAGIGAFCLWRSDDARRFGYRMLYRGMRFYGYINTKIDELRRDCKAATTPPKTQYSNGKDDGEEAKDHITLIYYDPSEDVSYCTDDLSESNLENVGPHWPLLLLRRRDKNGDDLFKRLTTLQDISGAEFVPVEKQFLQVELIQSSATDGIDIHDSLGPFYVDGNLLFDAVFLKWYMVYWYTLSLDGSYKLQIFDKNVNRFTLEATEGLLIKTDTYSKINLADEEPSTCSTT